LEEACSLIQKISSGEHFHAIDFHFSGRKFPRVQISPVAIQLYWPFKEGVLEKLEKENISLSEGIFVGETSASDAISGLLRNYLTSWMLKCGF